MAAHRFREFFESITPEPTLGTFVPCPVALLQLLTPAQQAMTHQLYLLAAALSAPRSEPASRWLIEFSLN